MAAQKEYASAAFRQYQAALLDFADVNEEILTLIARGENPPETLLQREHDARIRLIAARRSFTSAWRA
jgi:hypothetical protein